MMPNAVKILSLAENGLLAPFLFVAYGENYFISGYIFKIAKNGKSMRRMMAKLRHLAFKRGLFENLSGIFCFQFLQQLLIIGETISNSRKSFSSGIQTSRLIWSCCCYFCFVLFVFFFVVVVFFQPHCLFGVWKSEEILFRAFDIHDLQYR